MRQWLGVRVLGLGILLVGLYGCREVRTNAAPPAVNGTPALGMNASLGGKRPFPADNPWNQPIDRLPIDPHSDTLIASIGKDRPLHPDFGANWKGSPFGIPYVVAAGNTPRVPVTFQYADESDPGPYPIPPKCPDRRRSEC